MINLDISLRANKLFLEERPKAIKHKHERKIEWISANQNIWKFARPIFKAYTPPFKGLTINSKLITNPEKIAKNLANHYEEYFTEPKPDPNNPVHQTALSIYENISRMPNIPLERISINEVMKEWKRLSKEINGQC